MAILNDDGSVSVSGITLSAAEVAAVKDAKPAFRPLLVTRGSGKKAGHEGEPRYGIFFNGKSWVFLNKEGQPIAGAAWRTRNLNRAKFEFRKPN